MFCESLNFQIVIKNAYLLLSRECLPLQENSKMQKSEKCLHIFFTYPVHIAHKWRSAETFLDTHHKICNSWLFFLMLLNQLRVVFDLAKVIILGNLRSLLIWLTHV